MAINYFVNPDFVLQNKQNDIFLETNHFSAKVKHKGLLAFLTTLQQQHVTQLSEDEFYKLAQDSNIRYQVLENFLVSQAGILKVELGQNNFDSVVIIGEGEVEQLLSSAIEETRLVKAVRAFEGQDIPQENAILVSFSNSLQSKRIKQIYDASSDDKNYIITSYLLGKHLVIDNPHCAHFGLPCHFCHIERLKQNSGLVPTANKKSWLSYFHHMLKQEDEGLFEPSLPKIYNQYISYCLFQFVRRFIDPFYEAMHYDEYNQFWHVQLDKMTITKEDANFWPFCSCQQGG